MTMFLAGWRTLIDKKVRAPFVRDVARMTGYLLAGQGLYIAMTPLLSRVYTPEELGGYGLILTAAVALSVPICLGYDWAIPAVRDDHEAAAVVVGGGAISIATSMLGAVTLALFVHLNWFGLGVLPLEAAPLLAVLLLTQALLQLLTGWLTRQQRIAAIGQATLNLNIGRSTTQLGLGLAGFGWAGLVLGEIAGRATGNFQILWRLNNGPVRTNLRNIQMAAVGKVLLRYRHFTMQLPGLMVDAMTPMVILTGVGFLYGLDAAGQFFLMRRVVDLPIGFIYRAISDAFYGRIAAEARNAPGQVPNFLIRVTLPVAAAAFVVMIVMIVAAPFFFELLFGEQWRTAGILAAIMAPAAAANLAVAPISRALFLSRRAYLRYIFTAINTGGSALALAATHLLHFDLIMLTAVLSGVIFLSYCSLFVCIYVGAGHLHGDTSGSSKVPLQP